jgi:N-acetylmuramoyl-L-alanine amidase
MIVILGTAHGSNIGGKRSPDGKFFEYIWSRNMCRLIKEELLNYGIESYIDIEEDEEPSLKERVNRVNAICDARKDEHCIYISIHVNAGPEPKWTNATGCTVYVYRKCSENSRVLALCYHEAAEELGLLGNRVLPETKYFESGLYVCKNTKCPAILTENGFMTTKENVEWLDSEEGMKTICDLHIKTIQEYLRNV